MNNEIIQDAKEALNKFQNNHKSFCGTCDYKTPPRLFPRATCDYHLLGKEELYKVHCHLKCFDSVSDTIYCWELNEKGDCPFHSDFHD